MAKNKPVLFSEHFRVDKKKLAELGIFNPILNLDTQLFVDPLLLKTSSDTIIKESFNNYNKFFADLLKLLQISRETGDKCWRAAKELVYFPEYKATCIGYGADTISGSGSGRELNDKILQSAKEIVNFAQGSPDIFLLLPLLEKGVGADIISDMTQHIIDDDICRYTVAMMEKLEIKGTHKHQSRKQEVYYLPYNTFHKCVVKLLPLNILSNLPMADTFDDWILDMAGINSELRAAVNRTIGDAWFKETKKRKKETILELIKNDKAFFLEILKTLQDHSLEHYDLEEDYQGLYRWLEDSKKFIKFDTDKTSEKKESMYQSVEIIVGYFKALIENKELWRMFWTKHYSKMRHVNEFYSQMLFYMVCESWLTAQNSNINFERVFDRENKQLYFKFFTSAQHIITLHIKHSDNYSGLEKGYSRQLTACKTKQGNQGFYVVMDFRTERTKQLDEIAQKEDPLCKIIEIQAIQEEPEDSMNPDAYEFGDLFTMYEGIDDSLYIQEKRKGGESSYKKNKPLKNTVEAICKDVLSRKHCPSALQLCSAVAEIIEKEHSKLLDDFSPYQQFKRDGGDWTKPTFYGWCNNTYKALEALKEPT